MSSDSEGEEFWAPSGPDSDSAAYNKLRAGAVSNDAKLIHEAKASGANLDAIFPEQDDDDEDGVAALHEAASRGNLEAIRALLADGAKIDIRAPEAGNQFEDRTPLYCAAQKGQPSAVSLLLEAGANPRALGPRDDTPFRAVLGSLVQRSTGDQKVQVDQQRVDTINAFIEHGVDANDVDNFNGPTVIEQAAALGDRKLIQNLLDHGVKADDALTAAAGRQNGLEMVEYLMNQGLEDSHGQALSSAARNNCLEVARFLLARHSIKAATDSGALHAAASNGHTDMIGLLLDHGLPVDALNAEGATPLLVACASNRLFPAVIQLLLDRGANVKATVLSPFPKSRYRKGDTPLHIAARYSYTSHVSPILHAGAELNARNNDQQTPLHIFAAGFNNGWPMAPEDPRPEVLRIVVEAGADVNAEDSRGNTPMLLLGTNARVGRREKILQAAKLLIVHGATGSEELACRVEGKDAELAEQLKQLTR